MGAKSQFNRVIFILDAMQSGRYPTARQIAEEYEISERTVRRDIEWLRDFHDAPIEYDRRHRGYVLTDPTYRLPALTMSEGELLAITIGEQVLDGYRNSPWHEPVRRAFARMEALLPDRITVSAQLLSRRVSVITPPVSAIAPEVWSAVLNATRLSRVAEIEYYRAGDGSSKTRTVHPYRLIAHDGSWYLIGWSESHESMRVFSLARIRGVTLTEGAFEIPVDFSESDYIDPELGVYNRSEEGPRRIVVRFDPGVAHLVTERRWHSSQEIVPEEDGSVLLQLTTNQTDQILYRVMGFGPAAEILSPADLRDTARDWVERMHRRYRESG